MTTNIITTKKIGYVLTGSVIQPIHENGMLSSHFKRLNVAVRGTFSSYPEFEDSVAYYEFFMPINGYKGFLCLWANVMG